MSAPSSDDTALGTARGRFVASLPRKAVELRGVLALLTSTPAAVAPRDEMRRRLQTLYASALVFRDDPLAQLVKGGIERIDLAQQQGRGLTTYDLKSLAQIVSQLPSLHKAERGVVLLTAALRDEQPLDPAQEDAVVQAALDAQLPEVTDAPLGGSGENTVKHAISQELAQQSRQQSSDLPGGGAGFAVPIAGINTVPTRVRKHPVVTEEYADRVSRTLTGMSPIEAEEAAAEARQGDMRQGRATSARPTQPAPVVEYGSEEDRIRRSQPPGAADGHLRLSSSPIVSSGPLKVVGRAPLLQRVVRVLVLDTPERQDQIRLQLPRSGFEVAQAEDPETALRLARSEGPDVVVAERSLCEHADLIRRLRSDPLTDFIPVVLLQGSTGQLDAVAARELGADELLPWPTQAHALAECIGRLTGTLVDEGNALATLSEATIAEVADRVADEIRHGLVDSAEAGLDIRVPLGGGAEVLAAAWAAVARVRAFVAQQSGGRIRFRDLPTRGGPAVLALVDGDAGVPTANERVKLTGRCILVVDDDPAVVWFFAGLLREEGALVLEAGNGREALEMARGRRPDVVISDILMPELDGFALCRAMQRDPLLTDVPVILLSWKEDLLHRMRELQAGASGYLRKEAASAQILGRVREVLRLRAELEAALIAGGEVRGSLEGVGLVSLLRSVARTRPNCRVTLRDAWNVFEIELRGGAMRALTRTSSDGGLNRGEAALPPLLGTVSGRYVITDSAMKATQQMEGDLDEQLARGARVLGALIDAVSGAGLLRARRVEFDPDALGVVREQSPGPMRDLVERLHGGTAPAEVLLQSDTTAHTLEAVLVDLARRGAIREVYGGRGESLVEEALRARAGTAPPDPADAPLQVVKAPVRAQERSGVSAEDSGEDELLPELDFGTALDDEDEPEEVGALAAATAGRKPKPKPEPASVEPAARASQASVSAQPASARGSAGASPAPEGAAPKPVPTDQGAAAKRVPTKPAEESSFSWGWLLALLVLAGGGFVGARYLGQQQARTVVDDESAAASPTEPVATATPEPEPEPEPEPVGPGDSLEPLPAPEALVVPQDVGFQIYEGITDSTVEVAEEQGLLIVGADPKVATELRIDGQSAGELPVKTALDEGIHALELRAEGGLRHLFVAITPGKTWVLAEP